MVERSASVAERKRWEELRARLRVSDAESAVAVAVAEERLASGNKGNARNARSVFACADAARDGGYREREGVPLAREHGIRPAGASAQAGVAVRNLIEAAAAGAKQRASTRIYACVVLEYMYGHRLQN